MEGAGAGVRRYVHVMRLVLACLVVSVEFLLWHVAVMTLENAIGLRDVYVRGTVLCASVLAILYVRYPVRGGDVPAGGDQTLKQRVSRGMRAALAEATRVRTKNVLPFIACVVPYAAIGVLRVLQYRGGDASVLSALLVAGDGPTPRLDTDLLFNGLLVSVLTEELGLRRCLHAAVRQHTSLESVPRLLEYVIPGVSFGVMHLINFTSSEYSRSYVVLQSVVGCVMGIALSVYQERAGFPFTIALHLLNNAVSLLLPMRDVPLSMHLLHVLLGVLALVSSLYYLIDDLRALVRPNRRPSTNTHTTEDKEN